MNEERFMLGVNYWPRRKAMYWWSDFDAGEVREEFSVIKEIGMDLVRIEKSSPLSRRSGWTWSASFCFGRIGNRRPIV
jgi:hypothetical protein